MANGYNPYQIAGSQAGILEDLLRTQQLKKIQDIAVGKQKGKMTKEFEAEHNRKLREWEKIQARKRKKKPWEKLLPVVSMFAGPWAGAILSAIGGIGSMKSDVKSEKSKLAQMEALGLGGTEKYGGTFLGSQARDISGKADIAIDKGRQALADIGMGDYLTTAILEGIKGYSAGKTGEGIKSSFKGLKTGNVVAGKDAKILRDVQKSGIDKMSFTDAEGLSIDPTYGNMSNVDFSQMSGEELDKIKTLGKKLNIGRPQLEWPENMGAHEYTKAVDRQYIADTLNKAFGTQGQETLFDSLTKSLKSTNMTDMLKGDDAKALEALLISLGFLGGKY